MRSNFDTLITLATHVLNHLTQDKFVEYGVDKRASLIDTFATELGVSFATDEDIRDQAIEEVQEKFGMQDIPDDITETEMYNHARKEIIKSFQGENIGGLYLVESLHKIAIRSKDFLLNCDLIDEVYMTDKEIIDALVQSYRKFNPRNQGMQQQYSSRS